TRLDLARDRRPAYQPAAGREVGAVRDAGPEVVVVTRVEHGRLPGLPARVHEVVRAVGHVAVRAEVRSAGRGKPDRVEDLVQLAELEVAGGATRAGETLRAAVIGAGAALEREGGDSPRQHRGP